MSEIRLSLLSPPPNIPLHLYTNGRVYFDLPSGFDILLSNAATKVTLEGFSEVVAVGFDLPDSPKNRLILATYSDIDWYNLDQSQGVNVICEYGAYTLPQSLLKIKKYTKGVSFDSELEYANDDILFGLKNTKLCDLMEQEFSITLFDLNDYYWNLSQYDGQSDICYPLVNFGRFYYLENGSDKLTVHAVEFRPHLFAAAVFKKAFCGVHLEGTLLDSDFWNKIVTYDLRRNYDTVLNVKRGFNRVSGLINLTPSSAADIRMYHGTVISDPDNNYQVIPATWAGASAFNRHGVYNVNANVNITTLFFGAGAYASIDVTFNIKKTNGEIVHSETKTFFTPPNNIYNFTFEGLVDMIPSDGLYIECVGIGAIGAVGYDVATYSSSFSFEPIKDCTPYEGEVVRLRDFLDQEITVFDYIKGISDANNLRYVLNRANATLGIYSETAETIYGENIQSLLSPTKTALNWSDKCDPTQLVISYPQASQSVKDITVAWKNATDAYITQVLKPERELYSYYELVDGNADKEIKIENGLFEPTATVNNFYWASDLRLMPYLPVMTDNNDASGNLNGQKSYELGHRIMLLVGGAVQSYPQSSALVRFDFLSQLTTDIIDTTAFSFATMYFDGTIDPSSIVYFTKNLTFDKGSANLYTELFKKSIGLDKESPTFEMQVLLSLNDFLSFDFTQTVVVKSNGKPVEAQVVLIDQFSLTKQQTTNVRLRKLPNLC